MNYFKLDIQRLITNKLVLTSIFLLIGIAILDPLTVSSQFTTHPNWSSQIGENPYQFWMLMNSVSWGNNIYNTSFWIIIVLLTGLIFFNDKQTSMYKYQIIRNNQKAYLFSKFLSIAIFSFVFVLIILEVNFFLTYTLFPKTFSITDYYLQLTPNKGSFVYNAFLSNPIKVVQIYTFLNAFSISMFSTFVLCIHMIFNFRNRYIALLSPIIILYGITFIFDSYPPLFGYNIRMILQPQASIALTTVITWEKVLSTIGCWCLAISVMIGIVFFKSRDVYE